MDRNLILLVEDNPDHAALVSRLIQRASSNCEIDIAENGQEMFEKVALKRLPKLILLDINMPGKDGIECLKELRAIKEYTHVPVIMLTTSQANKDISMSYEAGCNAYISKSADFEQMAKSIESIVEFWIDNNQTINQLTR